MYPTKQEFENYLSLRLRDGRVTYHEINNTAYTEWLAMQPADSGSSGSSGSSASSMSGMPGGQIPTTSASSSGSGAGDDPIDVIFQTVTREEFDMADINGDGLTPEEAFALFVMKLEQSGEFKDDKYVKLAMANMLFWSESPGVPWNSRDRMPKGEPLTLEGLAGWFADMDDMYAGGTDPMEWPEKPDENEVRWAIDMFDADGDGKLSRAEGYTLGLSMTHNDLFSWMDMDEDGFLTYDEGWSVYKTVVEDGQKGKFVCDGLEVIDATSGKIDIRAPMGVSGAACGWLIMPSWFYGRKGPAMMDMGGMDMGGMDMGEDKGEYSLRRKLPRVAHAAMRSKSHRRNSHEVKSTHTIQNAARKLLQT